MLSAMSNSKMNHTFGPRAHDILGELCTASRQFCHGFVGGRYGLFKQKAALQHLDGLAALGGVDGTGQVLLHHLLPAVVDLGLCQITASLFPVVAFEIAEFAPARWIQP